MHVIGTFAARAFRLVMTSLIQTSGLEMATLYTRSCFGGEEGEKEKRNEEEEEKTEDRHDLLRLGKTNIAATKIAEQA